MAAHAFDCKGKGQSPDLVLDYNKERYTFSDAATKDEIVAYNKSKEEQARAASRTTKAKQAGKSDKIVVTVWANQNFQDAMALTKPVLKKVCGICFGKLMDLTYESLFQCISYTSPNLRALTLVGIKSLNKEELICSLKESKVSLPALLHYEATFVTNKEIAALDIAPNLESLVIRNVWKGVKGNHIEPNEAAFKELVKDNKGGKKLKKITLGMKSSNFWKGQLCQSVTQAELKGILLLEKHKLK